MKLDDEALQPAADALFTVPLAGPPSRPGGPVVRGHTVGDAVAEALTADELEAALVAVRVALPGGALFVAAAGRIAAALELHHAMPGTSTCRECFVDGYPCPTVRVLTGADNVPAVAPRPAPASAGGDNSGKD